MWLFKGRKRASEPLQDSDSPQVKRLLKTVESLQAHVLQLQQQLAAAGQFSGDYLWRKRTAALPLLGPDWEQRYFVLQGTTIKYYKSHKDVIFSPREEFSTLGCAVEWQGLQGTNLWVLALIDPGGSEVLSIGSKSEQTALKWKSLLEGAGCARQSSSIGHVARLQSMPASSQPTRRIGSSFESVGVSSSREPATPTRRAPRASSQSGYTSHFSPTGHAQQWTDTPHKDPYIKDLQSHGAADTEGEVDEPPAEQGSSGSGSAGISRSAGQTQGDADVAAAAETKVQAAQASVTSAKEAVDTAAPVARQQHAGQPTEHSPASPTKPHRPPMLASSPVHQASRYSLLSSEMTWHTRQTGLYNLMAVILLATNFRLALENSLKYGWRYNPFTAVKDLTFGNPNIPLALCYPTLLLLAVLALLSEMLGYTLMQRELQLESALAKKGVPDKVAVHQVMQRRALHEWALFIVNVVITSATIFLPWAAISTTQAEPLAGGVLIGLGVIMWMKLVSYHHVHADLRNARRAGEIRPGERGSAATPHEWALLAYPENLTTSNLAYFLAAPTLSYQVNYPRSPSIRWKWLARRLAELAVMLTVLSLIVKQFMEPAINNSMKPLKDMAWLPLCERLLKLALPNTYCWLVMFYCLFHLWLNILGELLRFGDREFYKDWWNAPTLGDYWKLWNMPVHKWLLRHVYFPATRLGLTRFPAMVLVFFVSAVFHELLVGVPLHMVRLWAFAGIMLQVPMIMLTEWVRKRLNRDEAGNIVFWLMFCVVGQPLSLLLYAHDYVYQVKPFMCPPGNSTVFPLFPNSMSTVHQPTAAG